MQSKPVIDNQLDIQCLFRALWRGKGWIIGVMLLSVAMALLYSFLVRPQWNAVAVTDKPTSALLNKYYLQKQVLNNVENESLLRPAAAATTSEAVSLTEASYQEFITQLASYDTRRQFWLQSDYYKQRQEGQARTDAILLDDLIKDIQFIPRDEKKIVNDSIKLTAETAEDASRLLREYVIFANLRTVRNLNTGLAGDRQALHDLLEQQSARQLLLAQTEFKSEISDLERGLALARKEDIVHPQVSDTPENLPQTDYFLLGQPILQARIESLKERGPNFDTEYHRKLELLTALSSKLELTEDYQTYRYLRTPEEPVKRDSPRRGFLVILWGIVGAFVGAGIALVRCTNCRPV